MAYEFPMPENCSVASLGISRIPNPLLKSFGDPAPLGLFVADSQCVTVLHGTRAAGKASVSLDHEPVFELAGPREKIYFDPAKTRCGIVTCGGLCPGLNDVIRALVRQCWLVYGVRRIHGFRYGYQGLVAKYGHPVLDLNPEAVDGLEAEAGTVLASSRGNQDPVEMVDCLEHLAINVLFVIGGDGTTRGALCISEEIARRGLKIAVVGIPKTIDNDIQYIDESFGFQTAYSAAVEVLQAAHVEARGAPNGIGLVKVMGRHSGFIACHAALAMSDVNFVLIPEVPFALDGEHGFLNELHQRLLRRNHAVIALAEGAGQEHLGGPEEHDRSGNLVLKDIGVLLKTRMLEYFTAKKLDVNIRYIDPSYILRSVPPSAQDRIYCIQLAQHAAHAAMAGKTELLIGRYNNQFVHIPMRMATTSRKNIDPNGELYLAVLHSTGQRRDLH